MARGDRETGSRWRSFWRTLIGTALAFGGACYAFILVLDPYQNVPFSPPLPRAPVDTNQRFSYPALARNPTFDSAVLGTSTARLLDPRRLDARLGGRFVNLAMNDATAWEQAQIGALFLRHHPAARYLVIGVDVAWCETADRYRRLTFRLFPEWMYDDDPWNDLLYLFNDKALEQAVRELEYLLGAREAKYRTDGYRYFLPEEADYDLARARANIYGDRGRRDAAPVPQAYPARRRAGLTFPAHALLEELLERAPRPAVKVLMFVPYHVEVLRHQGGLYAECKARIVEIAARVPGTHVIDFMIPSPITAEDRNYWDQLHFTREVASTVVALLPAALAGEADARGRYRRLEAGRAP